MFRSNACTTLLLLGFSLSTHLALSTPALAQSDTNAPTAASSMEYPQPGDQIRVKIWREPDLSGDFSIDESGEVVLPQVGRLNVTGERFQVLQNHLVAEYGKFLNHNSIDITLLRRVQVLGAVRTPGLYAVDATMTVSDAIAMAGGATAQGKIDRVEIIRDSERRRVKLTANSQLTSVGIRSGDQLFVPERTWLARNTGIVTSGIAAAVSLFIAFYVQ